MEMSDLIQGARVLSQKFQAKLAVKFQAKLAVPGAMQFAMIQFAVELNARLEAYNQAQTWLKQHIDTMEMSRAATDAADVRAELTAIRSLVVVGTALLNALV
jgi:hypothetical protein